MDAHGCKRRCRVRHRKTTITGTKAIDGRQRPGIWHQDHAGRCSPWWQPPQEEVHRFSITYQKSLRGKSIKESTLSRIPGLGEQRIRALRRTRHHRQDPPGGWEELAQVVPHNVAVSIRNYFDGEGQRTEETT